jgi:DNA-damage-inducible protein J
MRSIKNDFIRARVEHDLKEHTHAIFYEMGVTPTQVITMLYKYVEHTHKLPFNPFVPNDATKTAIKEAREGKDVVVCKNADDMFKKLGISDANTNL